MEQHEDPLLARWPPATPTDRPPGDHGPWPPATPIDETPPAAVTRRRRWPWVIAVVLLGAVAATAVAAAIDQRDVAAQWQQRSAAAEAQLDRVLGQGEELELQLEEVAQLLDISETDVAALEGRIRELADEKAQAEDTATTVQVERDVFVDLSAQIVEATDALDACVRRLFDLQAASVDAFNRTTAGEPVDVEPLNAQARETTEFCNASRTAAARVSAAAEQLLRP